MSLGRIHLINWGWELDDSFQDGLFTGRSGSSAFNSLHMGSHPPGPLLRAWWPQVIRLLTWQCKVPRYCIKTYSLCHLYPHILCFYQFLQRWRKQCSSAVVVQSLSQVWLFMTPWTAACQVSLSFTIFRSLLKFMSIESVILSNHLILYCPLLLSSIFPSIRVFSKELTLYIR